MNQNKKNREKSQHFNQNQSQIQKYLLETPISTKTKDLKLRRKLKEINFQLKENADSKINFELLDESIGYLQGEGMERTFKFKQEEIGENVDLATNQKLFDLKLDFGEYSLDYTINGTSLLLGGKMGHLCSFDWKQKKLQHQMNVKEIVRDVTWLHNDTMYCAAQKKYSYIYDKTGMELHQLNDFIEVTALEYLRYHFLLVGVGNAGWLKYLDTSTGKLVSQHRTKLGKCDAIAQNPYNAIINLGHANGTVTLWSPAMQEPLVKMLCHRGPIKSLSVDQTGKYLATAGLDGQLKIWDIRTYKELDSYYTPTPASYISYSQTGLLSSASNGRVVIWKDLHLHKQKEPYMTSLIEKTKIKQLQFCPFEDVLGVGHELGFHSLIIPGSGKANFDSMEANPYQTVKQRQESEVHALLDKIQPDMITLDPTFVGKLDRAPTELVTLEREEEYKKNHPKQKFVPVKKKRGKSSSQRRYLRKQSNVIDEKRQEIKEKLLKQKKATKLAILKQKGIIQKSALDRFEIN